MSVQKISFNCHTIPELKDWKNSLFTPINKQENKIILVVDDKEATKVTIQRLLNVKEIPLKKEVKIAFHGLLGEVQSSKVYDSETVYFDGEINFTRKTCKLKMQVNLKKHFFAD